MPQGTLTSKGQITLPAELRRKLGLRAGDRVDFEEREGGIMLKPKKRPLLSLLGILHQPDRPPSSIEEMDEAVQQAVAEDWDRIRNQR